MGIVKNRQLLITKGDLLGKESMIEKFDRHKRTVTMKYRFSFTNKPIILGLEIPLKIDLGGELY